MKIGQNIYLARKRKGISQEELATKLEVSRQSISLWETDQTVPTLDKLFLISQFLEISMDELVGNKPLEKATLAINPIYSKEAIEARHQKSLQRTEIIFLGLSIIAFLLWMNNTLGGILSIACIVGNVILIIKKQRNLAVYALILSVVAFVAAVIGI